MRFRANLGECGKFCIEIKRSASVDNEPFVACSINEVNCRIQRVSEDVHRQIGGDVLRACYSDLSACITSTCEALAAGIIAASIPAPTITAAAPNVGSAPGNRTFSRKLFATPANK